MMGRHLNYFSVPLLLFHIHTHPVRKLAFLAEGESQRALSHLHRNPLVSPPFDFR